MRQANVLAKAGLYLGAMIAVVLVIFRDGTKLLPVSARRRVAGENENAEKPHFPFGYAAKASSRPEVGQNPGNLDKLFGKLVTGDDEFTQERIMQLMRNTRRGDLPCQQWDPNRLRDAYVNIVPNFHNTRNDGVIEREQQKRKQRVSQGCDKMKASTESLTQAQRRNVFDHVLVDDKHKLLYCYIPKVGCTNWKKVLKVMAERDPWPGCFPFSHLRDVTPLSQFSQAEMIHRLQTYYKFMFVREPMSRLLSAYIDKFHPNGTDRTYYGPYGIKIIKQYRKHPGEDISGKDVTWEEFIRYVIDLKPKDFNEHWAPYEHLCQPCIIDYDFIGHYEHLTEDANYVIRQVRADHRVAYPARQGIYHPSSSDKVTRMFQTLNSTMRHRISQIYAKSYELFQYDMPGYLRPALQAPKD